MRVFLQVMELLVHHLDDGLVEEGVNRHTLDLLLQLVAQVVVAQVEQMPP